MFKKRLLKTMVLSNSDYPRLVNQGVDVPTYDRNAITPGVVHIGASHFARAHVFKYFDEILQDDQKWGVRAIDIRSSQRRDVLRAQDYDYTVTERVFDGIKLSVVGSLMDITVAQENPQQALDVLCSPDIKLVTLTVTQQGYGHNPATQTLDFERDDIRHCLSNMDEPSTTVGYLVAALERRMNENAPPLTIMSCDNMPANGAILRNVVMAYATRKSPELRQYIEANITFPSTMVDRIVPTTTDADIFNIKAEGVDDEWPVVTESFMQWVIEDDFAGEVPDFASVGAIVTKDVEPFELMKLRMLNGAHMALGCVAGLAGHKLVDAAMEDDALRGFIDGFMDEALNTVPHMEGVNLQDYKQELVQRLQNPHMKDELVRLARNGTQKISGRVLDTIIDAKSQGTSHENLAFETAAWIQYIKATDDNGNAIAINDDSAVTSGLQQIAHNSNGNPLPVMEASGLFDRRLMNDDEFVADVSRHLRNIQDHGVMAAISMIDGPQLSVEYGEPKIILQQG